MLTFSRERVDRLLGTIEGHLEELGDQFIAGDIIRLGVNLGVLRQNVEDNRILLQLSKEESMDKKMHQVTKRMETAEKDVRKGKKTEAVKVLKKAEKKNEKLVKIDRDVRDPKIDKLDKVRKVLRGK